MIKGYLLSYLLSYLVNLSGRASELAFAAAGWKNRVGELGTKKGQRPKATLNPKP